MSIHLNEMLLSQLRNNHLTLPALGLDKAQNLDRVQVTHSPLSSLSKIDKIVIASGLLIATCLIVLGALAIRAEVLSVKNGSFLTKITAKGGYSMIGAAAGIALLSILFVKFYSKAPKELPPPIQGQGLRQGNQVLILGNFDPAKDKSSDLFVFNDQGELWHEGRKTKLEQVTVDNLPPGMGLTHYNAGGTTVLSRFTFEAMKMQLPPYYQANFDAMKRF